MSVTCNCDDALLSIPNQKCGSVDYGNQIVALFFQKLTGTTFDGTSNNNITVEADWDARIADTDDDTVVVLPYLSGAERPSQTGNVETDNDVPYGGEELIDVPQSISFDTKYLSADYFTRIEQVRCWGGVRMWFLDNKGYVWGSTTTGNGVENVWFRKATVGQTGITARTKAEGHMVSWNDLCEPIPIANLPFLRNKFEVSVSS